MFRNRAERVYSPILGVQSSFKLIIFSLVASVRGVCRKKQAFTNN